MNLFNIFHKKNYKSNAKYYKLNTLEQITSIPTPTEKFELLCDFTDSIEYVLQRKATEYKKAGKMDLAIACLKKSNEIMAFLSYSIWRKRIFETSKISTFGRIIC